MICSSRVPLIAPGAATDAGVPGSVPRGIMERWRTLRKEARSIVVLSSGARQVDGHSSLRLDADRGPARHGRRKTETCSSSVPLSRVGVRFLPREPARLPSYQRDKKYESPPSRPPLPLRADRLVVARAPGEAHPLAREAEERRLPDERRRRLVVRFIGSPASPEDHPSCLVAPRATRGVRDSPSARPKRCVGRRRRRALRGFSLWRMASVGQSCPRE